MVNASIFDGLTEAERGEMFDWEGDEGRIKPWLRDGVTWQVGDASDPNLITSLGPQDLVVANNFLCHMPARSAQLCLRNLAQLVSPGGYLFVTGVDLDVRTKVALELGWEPIPELRAEIHDGDPLVRSDWPWRWWGLEPLDRRRPDWETRYSAVFRIGTDPHPRAAPAAPAVQRGPGVLFAYTALTSPPSRLASAEVSITHGTLLPAPSESPVRSQPANANPSSTTSGTAPARYPTTSTRTTLREKTIPNRLGGGPDINHLKRRYGLDRSHLKGDEGR